MVVKLIFLLILISCIEVRAALVNSVTINNPVTVSGTQFKNLGTQLLSGDRGLITNSVIHGLSTGGGGGYVDVKVNPSGALVADVTGSLVSATVLNQITGFNLESTQLNVLSELQSIDNRLVSPLSVSGTITANVTFPSSQSVNVLNFPAVQDVSGSVQVSNFPLVQSVSTTGVNAVSGFVTVNNPVTSLAVNNFPTFTGLTNAELRANPVVVSGSVSVSTLPNITVASSALPTNAATQTTAAQSLSVLQTIDAEVGLGTTTLGEIRDKLPQPTQRTPSYTSSTTTGTVSAGAKLVSFYNAGLLNATVLGTTLSAGDSITFQAPDQDTLGAITYVATSTTLRILEVR